MSLQCKFSLMLLRAVQPCQMLLRLDDVAETKRLRRSADDITDAHVVEQPLLSYRSLDGGPLMVLMEPAIAWC